ncbi:MAG TPA: OmpA family protein [Chitinophagales bacterium]|nr:OmpA family protein [Chitinophagales bacterium]
MKNLILTCCALLILSLSSCLVSKKKYDEQVALADKYKTEKEDCNEKLNAANATIDDLNKQIAALGAEIQKLKDSNASLEDKNKRINALKAESDAICQRVKEQLDQITNSSAAEKDKLLRQLAERERDLMNKAAELDKLSRELNDRDARLREMEALIARKDSAVQALKNKMLDALKGFNAGDLTVYEKDGKIYVALSDKLLFTSGSYSVEPRGKEALKKIAEVLNKQTDISILVEGHTDNKPYVSKTTGPVNSNWDLSVMRASSVTKLLVDENKLDARRVTPAGRGEYFPVESNETAEGRSKNRRIDIVLEPDMKGIMKILNGTN